MKIIWTEKRQNFEINIMGGGTLCCMP